MTFYELNTHAIMEGILMNATTRRQKIDAETLLTAIFVLVDDWYQAHAERFLTGKRGAKPTFSDSELITLLLAMDYFPYPGETQYLEYIRANHLALFPKLVDQSQFNRRARALRLLVEEFRKFWMRQLGAFQERVFLLDTKPVPVLGYKRDKRHSDFATSANYGVCPSRKMKYFGYKLVMFTTLDGLPVAYELVPANTDERKAADELLPLFHHCHVLTDKGFIDEDWQAQWAQHQGVRIWHAKRKNQQCQNPPEFDRWLTSIRERIEGAFNELRNTGRDLERLLRKTVLGVCTHVIAKVTSHTLKVALRRFFHIEIQTFSTEDLELQTSH
jgi:hypothetical protein